VDISLLPQSATQGLQPVACNLLLIAATCYPQRDGQAELIWMTN